MEHGAETPDVIGQSVGFRLEQLWGGVARGAYSECALRLFRRQDLRAAHVSQVELLVCVATVANQNIVYLDVAVEDVAVVHGLKTSGQLFQNLLAPVLLKRLDDFALGQLIEEVAVVHELRHDLQLFLIVVKALYGLEDVRHALARQQFQHLGLLEGFTVRHECPLNQRFLYLLQRVFDLGILVLDEEDSTEAAGAENAQLAVLLYRSVREALRRQHLAVHV